MGRKLYNVEITHEILYMAEETIEGQTQDHVTFQLWSRPIEDAAAEEAAPKTPVPSITLPEKGCVPRTRDRAVAWAAEEVAGWPRSDKKTKE